MISNFEEIINKHKNDICVIVGAGPTMNNFDYKNFKGQILLIGGAILRIDKKIKPNYLISCNNHFPIVSIKSHMDVLRSFKNNPTWILSDTCAHSDLWNFDLKEYENLSMNCTFFDDRHYELKHCQPKSNCCKFLEIYPKRKTLIEYVEDKYLNKFNFKEKKGSSVVDNAFMIATLMGFKTILIQGVDLPEKNYQGKVSGKTYYGAKNEKADKFEDEEINKLLRKKFFFYYIKNLNFKPYLKSFYLKLIKKITKKSIFFDNLNASLNIFQWLTDICKDNDKEVFYLSENSNLKKINNLKFISFDEIHKKYYNKFS